MEISEQGLALIRRFEAFSPKAYRCPAGKMTIGYGHVITVGDRFPKEGITEEAANALLYRDVQKASTALSRHITVNLTQNQVDALISIIFNIGAGAFARSTLKRVINRGWHAEVPGQMARWVFAGGKIQPGLVVRRSAEGEMYAAKD